MMRRRYAAVYQELLRATYGAYSGEQGDELWAHPYGKLDLEKAWAHVDRVCFRAPDAATTRGRRRIQRPLAPHVDCCPYDMHPANARRWRPIQCLISLSGGLHPNEGGFEAVRGFHREFAAYYANRANAKGVKALDGCVGDFIAVNNADDAPIIDRLEHVPVPPGAALFWDRRLPHASARWNNSRLPRRAVYGGYLPKGPILNQCYTLAQWDRCTRAAPQPDFWIERPDDDNNSLKPSLSELAAFLDHLPGAARARLGFADSSVCT